MLSSHDLLELALAHRALLVQANIAPDLETAHNVLSRLQDTGEKFDSAMLFLPAVVGYVAIQEAQDNKPEILLLLCPPGLDEETGIEYTTHWLMLLICHHDHTMSNEFDPTTGTWSVQDDLVGYIQD